MKNFKLFVESSIQESIENITGKLFGAIKKINNYVELIKSGKEGSSEDIINLVISIPQKLIDAYGTFRFKSDRHTAYEWADSAIRNIKNAISDPQYGQRWGEKLQKSELNIINQTMQQILNLNWETWKSE